MLTDITLGQYFPGNSFIHKLDPRTKLLATLIYIIAIFFAATPLAYGILTAFAAVVILISRVPWMLVFKSLKPIWIIVILTMLIHMFTAPGEHIVFTWKFLSVTAEGIDMGVKMAVRLILLLLFSSVLTFTTSPIVLTDGIENLLRPFKKLGVPAHELAMMMTIALRFIPTLLDETDRIMKAQTSRGADFASGNIFQRMKICCLCWCRCLSVPSVVPMNWLWLWKLAAIAAVKDVHACMSWYMPAAIIWPLL